MRRTVLGMFLGLSLLIATACEAQGQNGKHNPGTPLEKTEWKLIWLAGAKIEIAAPQQVPYFQLDRESHRVSGSGGCNRLMGGYELEGDHLRFTQMAMSRIACLHGGDTESTFAKALDQVREWMISKGRLLLLDADHKVLAKFSPVTPED